MLFSHKTPPRDDGRSQILPPDPLPGNEEPQANLGNELCSQSIPTVYDSGRRSWWTRDGGGEWIEITETAVRRLLKMEGLSAETGRGESISPLDRQLVNLQWHHNVRYAGPLAGWPQGIHSQPCGRILVTSEPAIQSTNRATLGVYATTKEILRNMLGDHQFAIWMAWNHVRRSALLNRTWVAGQALCLIGPPGCGKSLAQWISTLLLGGRASKPWRYMNGDTPFNADFFGCEHLVIEDEAASTDIRARRQFGANIKGMLFARDQSCHAKNRQAITLEPRWALTLSCNSETENLMVLPPLDESLADKITLLKCEKHPFPFSSDTAAGQQRLRETIAAELSALAAAVDAYEIPAELRDERCGVVAYQHPDLLAALDSLAPETRLLELIDDVIFRPHPARFSWEGYSTELAAELRRSDTYGREAEKLLHYRDAAGTYLGRICKRHPDRVSRRIFEGRNRWTITSHST